MNLSLRATLFTTWYGARPRPRRLCVRWGPRRPSPKKGRSPQTFGPCLLRSNGWMDEAGTWHGGRPRPRRLCVRWGPSPAPKRGRSPKFSAHVYCSLPYSCEEAICLRPDSLFVLVIIEFGLNIMRNPVTLLTLFVLKIDCSMSTVTVTVTSFKNIVAYRRSVLNPV